MRPRPSQVSSDGGLPVLSGLSGRAMSASMIVSSPAKVLSATRSAERNRTPSIAAQTSSAATAAARSLALRTGTRRCNRRAMMLQPQHQTRRSKQQEKYDDRDRPDFEGARRPDRLQAHEAANGVLPSRCPPEHRDHDDGAYRRGRQEQDAPGTVGRRGQFEIAPHFPQQQAGHVPRREREPGKGSLQEEAARHEARRQRGSKEQRAGQHAERRK